MQTISLANHLYHRATDGSPEPEVGMGATILGWTDRYAGTVEHVMPNGCVKVRRDTATRSDSNGMSDAQTYDYSPNPTGAIYWFRRDKNGRWQEVERNIDTGRWRKVGGYGLALGVRHEFYDFTF